MDKSVMVTMLVNLVMTIALLMDQDTFAVRALVILAIAVVLSLIVKPLNSFVMILHVLIALVMVIVKIMEKDSSAVKTIVYQLSVVEILIVLHLELV
jgi:hypothetical protein